MKTDRFRCTAEDLYNHYLGWFPYFLGTLEGHLTAEGVDILKYDWTPKPWESDRSELVSLLNGLRARAMDSLLYLSIEPLGSLSMNGVRIRVECLTADGKLLWEEGVSGTLPDAPPADALADELMNKLKHHLGNPGLPRR